MIKSFINKGFLLGSVGCQQFEPENTLANKDKTEVFASVYPTLLPCTV